MTLWIYTVYVCSMVTPLAACNAETAEETHYFLQARSETTCLEAGAALRGAWGMESWMDRHVVALCVPRSPPEKTREPEPAPAIELRALVPPRSE